MKKKTRLVAIAAVVAMLILAFSSVAWAAEGEWQKVLCSGDELNDVRNIVETDAGYWVCTKGGLYFVTNAGQVEQMFAQTLKTQFVYDIAEDQQGNYYVTQGFTYAGGVNYGLLYINADGELLAEFTMENSALPDNFVQAVEVDEEGRVWIGSGAALSCFTPSTDEWRVYGTADGLPAAAVNTLVQDGQGGMWVGHYPTGAGSNGGGPFSGGYAHIDAAGRITAYSYNAEQDAYLNSFLLSDFWTRGIAIDGEGGAYVIRSGTAPNYFHTQAYLGADGKPIDISACVGGRLDYIGADGVVARYTGRELTEIIDQGIVAPDYANNIPGATPELRVAAVDLDGRLWLGTSGAGLLTAAGVDGVYTQYASANTAAFDNSFFDNIYALAALRDGSVAVGSQGGLRVLKNEPAVVRSEHAIVLNGTPVSLPAYNINGNNYFKLRDLAYVLNGGAKQFAVDWDAATQTVNLLPGSTYAPVGGEGDASVPAQLTVGASTHRLAVDGKAAVAAAYNINGNNYFKLRDISRLLDFRVAWDEVARAAVIDTSLPYGE